jgi:drug/metabolite transporter (DMT)-like permease
MKNITIIGIVLVVLGVVGLIYGGLSYTSSNNTVHMGDVNLQIEEKKRIPISPIAGAVALVGGGILILAGRKPQSSRRAL